MTQHLLSTLRPGFNLCGERSDPKYITTPRHTTCHHCLQQWKKANGGL
jgi:hypothetical protein